MDARKIVTSLPILRRAWRWLPGPLRIPLLIIGAAIWLWRRVTDRGEPEEQAAGDGNTAAVGGRSTDPGGGDG